MSYLKNTGHIVTIGSETYEIALNMNIVDAIYDKYGSMVAFYRAMYDADERAQIAAVSWILMVMVNDAIDAINESGKDEIKPFIEKSFRRRLSPKDYKTLAPEILATLRDGMPEPEAESGGEDLTAEMSDINDTEVGDTEGNEKN